MKKIITLFTIFILISCSNWNNNDIEVKNKTEDIIINNESINKEAINSMYSDNIVQELTELTTNNFNELIVHLSEMDIKDKVLYDCNNFILPESNNRPDFQLKIQNDFYNKCSELVHNSKLIYYKDKLTVDPYDIYKDKEDYSEEYEDYLKSLSWSILQDNWVIDYDEFVLNIKTHNELMRNNLISELNIYSQRLNENQ